VQETEFLVFSEVMWFFQTSLRTNPVSKLASLGCRVSLTLWSLKKERQLSPASLAPRMTRLALKGFFFG
jgi:hypothetical protein